MSSLFLKSIPGDQVCIIPMWAFKTLAKKGQIEDLYNFSKMRSYFSQEQLLAIDAFSGNGLSVLWYNGNIYDKDHLLNTRNVGYNWCFNESAGVSDNGTEADRYVKDKLSDLGSNKEYTNSVVKEYVLSYLSDVPSNKIDLLQSYSVYSSSDKLIVLALNQGITSTEILTRVKELRLMILRSMVDALKLYYPPHIVHQTSWFELYLKELDQLK